MKIKESEYRILLLSIILFSILFNRQKVYVPNNHIEIIHPNQIPFYDKPKTDSVMLQNSLSLEVDKTKDSTTQIDQNFGKNWMRRYSKGIRFEFYPP